MKIIDNKKQIQKYITQCNLESIITNDYLQYVSLHVFAPQEMIMREDDISKYFYIILEGQSRVAPSSTTGKIALLDYLKQTDMLGDIEYFYNEPNYHSVIALTKCVLLAIDYKHLNKHFKDNLAFYRYVSHSLAGKIRNSSIRHSRTLLYPVKNRLAKYIYDLSEYEKTNLITIQFNRTAEYLGITPRHFRRILAEFEGENILKRHSREIEIIDKDALHKYSTYK